MSMTASGMTTARFVATALMAAGAVSVTHAEGEGRSPVRLSIQPQMIDGAINAWARQTGMQVLMSSSQSGEGGLAPAIEGSYTPESALKTLLTGTDLQYHFVNSRTVAIHETEGGASSPIRLAQNSTPSSGSQSTTPSDRSNAPVAEVLVTAQKRSERLQDVPIPVSSVNADALVSSNQIRLEDYYSKIPGMSLTTTGVYGGSVISIRGITSGVFNDGTVSVVVDDVPYGTTSAQGPGEVVPELDPSELQRLEVLRGPQSTLYGASSLGGLVKYVTVDPSTDAFKATLQGSLGGIRNGNGMGYSARGAINMPVSEAFAVRASAFTRYQPGYIDDPVHNLDGVNSGRVSGGRVSALWKLSESFSLKLGALFEDSTLDGNSYVNVLPGQTQLSGLQQSTVPGSGGYHKKLQVYSANLSGEVGNTSITSISAYSISNNEYHFDQTPTLSATANRFFGVQGAEAVQTLETKKFTQELRATMPLGDRLEWLVGGFFGDERTPQNDLISAANFTTGAPVGTIAFLDLPSTYREYALFSDLTVKITERFDVQFGGRGSYNKQSLKQTNSGPLFNGFQDIPKQFSSDRSFTYLLTPRFRLSDDLMLYARFASGYRPGGPNTNAALGVPAEFGPDRTLNYELGVKGTAFDRMLTFDASVYHIDWKDLLVTLREPIIGASYKANAGQAKSEGVDLSIELRPLSGLTISTWGAWNVAELSENFPVSSTVHGVDGDRLPFSSRFSGNFAVDQEFSLFGGLMGVVGADLSYVGDRVGIFTASGVRERFPSYTKLDARIGTRSGSWETNLYVNNATDRRGLINGGAGNLYPNTYAYIQPRTYGVSLMKSF